MNRAPSLTPEQIAIVARLLNRVLNYIAGDFLGDRVVSRSEVFEICCDADRPRSEARTPEEKAALEAFYTIPYDRHRRMAKLFFPYSRYCN